MFSKRIIEPELLDHLPPEEARPNVADLVRINRKLGGHSVVRRTLASVIKPNEHFTMLDVGAASGDAGVFIRQLYPAASVVSLDYNSVHLEAAPQPKVIANAFQLPIREKSFDFVMNSLFLHHFSDEQVVDLLGRFYRIARRALFAFDLERHIIPYYFLPATKRIFGWNTVTVHDGCISVRAAFRANELLDLAKKAGLQNAAVTVYRPAFRIALVAGKNG